MVIQRYLLLMFKRIIRDEMEFLIWKFSWHALDRLVYMCALSLMEILFTEFSFPLLTSIGSVDWGYCPTITAAMW